MTHELAATAVILIPYLLLTEDAFKIALNGTVAAMVLLAGVVHTDIAYALYFGSMKNLKVQSIAVMSYIAPVFTLLISTIMLNEKLPVFGMIGAVLFLGSTIVNEAVRE